ncbi:hypothetical protein A3A39_01790 [Candidatus Kaiserbacteria bacterium RIFCSPLOWO2_01_FULL_54_13]|uniref:Type II toxin-antitoxin system mRNA interferase toxin, RelE/StbE family n=1 Tax=Candidatus Kaiserbacteria bacterium RIFCSPLOWO2_01_FULL_54_13 TaxID=1798512 RepID=A0A1F6F1E6_9BACT|nr:MAG: hypothetical protein A3A39_01790 [Candidatus Kaiserbacteria bacterium RIFCSPLOWO2_01_FULL_54_13]
MKYERTFHFKREYKKFSIEIQKAFEKQAMFLLHNIRHPSLRAKKYDEARDIWQARVTHDVRFYFRIEGDTYHLLNIRRHPK